MKLELYKPAAVSTDRPPLLFIHGAWHSAWCWRVHFIPYFSQAGFATYALSLRGHGASEGRERLRWTRISDYVADVVTVIEQELPAPPVLIGHSMGGLVVQKYLENHTAPAAILLAAVPPAGILATTLRLARRHFKEFLLANVTLNLYPLVGTPALAREAFFSDSMPPETVAKYYSYLQSESYRAFLDMLVLNLPRPERITTPLLILGGADDTIFRPSEIQRAARAYHTDAHIFPAVAHDMMLEERWQEVAATMLAWLTGGARPFTDGSI